MECVAPRVPKNVTGGPQDTAGGAGATGGAAFPRCGPRDPVPGVPAAASCPAAPGRARFRPAATVAMWRWNG